MNIRKLFRRAAALLFPPRCLYCGNPTAGGAFCESCLDLWESEGGLSCPVCGCTAPFCRCTEMNSMKPVFRETVSAVSRFYAVNPERDGGKMTHDLILRNKTVCSEETAALLMRGTARRIQEIFRENGENPRDWCVTYPPRNPENLLRYGFDHGEVLAQALARYLGIPCVRTLFRCGGREQKELGGGERFENAASSLAPIRNAVVPGGKYIIADDVITTGATVTAAAELLYGCGAASVFPTACARTMVSGRQNV